jgi:hypothetical protein
VKKRVRGRKEEEEESQREGEVERLKPIDIQ